MIVINFIEQIIKNIFENIHSIPYSIKCLCKFISDLITIKFPSINIPQKSKFISKFFFEKLLIPILIDPGIEAFVNIFISENSYYNLKEISSILKKYVSCDLYFSNNNEFNYTPFNWYFINNIKNIFNISKELIKVKIPKFIENHINNKFPSDYEYDYFKENPDEIFKYQSILFNTEQLSALIETFATKDKEIFGDTKNNKIQKTKQKLMLETNKQIIQNIINMEKIDKKEDIKDQNKKKNNKKINNESENTTDKKVKFFLFTRLDLNHQFKQLLNIKSRTNFNLKELKKINDEESEMKNNIIIFKNYFFDLLYNINNLYKEDFYEGTTDNSEKILNELNILMKYPDLIMEDSIPSEWYIKTLLEYLKKLPENLTKNDCEELYKEMEEDLNKSIKELDFGILGFIMGKLEFTNKSKLYYTKCFEILEDLKANEKCRKLITQLYIPVDMKFEYNNGKEGLFLIDKSKLKEKDYNNEVKKLKYEKSNKIKFCLTIKNFIKNFPNLAKCQGEKTSDVFKLQENLKIHHEISKYYDYIRDRYSKQS